MPNPINTQELYPAAQHEELRRQDYTVLPQESTDLITRIGTFAQEHTPATFLVAGTLLLGVGAGKVGASDQPPKANGSQDSAYVDDGSWPPINQKIDGVEPRFEGSAFAEQLYADDCKTNSQYVYPNVKRMAKHFNRKSRTISTRVRANSISSCDGYGRRTSTIWTESKAPGSKKIIKGEKVTIKSNHLVEKTYKMNLKKNCKPGSKLMVRVAMNNSYEHIDHSKASIKPKTPFKSVSC